MPKRIAFFVALFLGLSQLPAKTIREYETLHPGEKVVARGAVYYSKPMLISVYEDGVKNRVVMAAKLFVKETPKGYEGYLIRGLYDLDLHKALRFYAAANIEGRLPPAGDKIDLRNIRLQGKTLSFDFYGVRYTVKDGGEGFINDEVVVQTRSKTKRLKLYGGDIKIFNLNQKEE